MEAQNFFLGHSQQSQGIVVAHVGLGREGQMLHVGYALYVLRPYADLLELLCVEGDVHHLLDSRSQSLDLNVLDLVSG